LIINPKQLDYNLWRLTSGLPCHQLLGACQLRRHIRTCSAVVRSRVHPVINVTWCGAVQQAVACVQAMKE
jgi:hypothetical protein